jgi:hypothetical protein
MRAIVAGDSYWFSMLSAIDLFSVAPIVGMCLVQPHTIILVDVLVQVVSLTLFFSWSVLHAWYGCLQ